jgi:hypothetical protein
MIHGKSPENARSSTAQRPRTWLVANPASGSVSAATLAAVVAALEAGGTLVGRIEFPRDALPAPETLDVDMLVVLAGDGTINAAAARYADWDGVLLILPGGTMNLLAKLLHGDATPAEIVARAGSAPAVALPRIEAAGQCAYVGLILGPAASWGRARERWRAGRVAGALRAMRHAWRRTFARRVRIMGVPGRAQAVFVRPENDRLWLGAVEAADWRSIADLGREWIADDWSAARAVTTAERDAFTLRGRRPVQALFDGELALLPPGTEVRVGRSRPMFVQTRKGSE